MDPENNQFFGNNKILHSFKGQIVLEGENEHFSDKFYQHFFSLIDKIEGNLLLTFVDVKSFANNYAEQCAQILSKKLECGKKVFNILLNSQEQYYTHGYSNIQHHMHDGFTIYYVSYPYYERRMHEIQLLKINSGVNTETLIDMINEDRFIEAKQHLGRVLPLVRAAELSGGEEDIWCGNCNSNQESTGDGIYLLMEESAWSNCADCRFK